MSHTHRGRLTTGCPATALFPATLTLFIAPTHFNNGPGRILPRSRFRARKSSPRFRSDGEECQFGPTSVFGRANRLTDRGKLLTRSGCPSLALRFSVAPTLFNQPGARILPPIRPLSKKIEAEDRTRNGTHPAEPNRRISLTEKKCQAEMPSIHNGAPAHQPKVGERLPGVFRALGLTPFRRADPVQPTRLPNTSPIRPPGARKQVSGPAMFACLADGVGSLTERRCPGRPKGRRWTSRPVGRVLLTDGDPPVTRRGRRPGDHPSRPAVTDRLQRSTRRLGRAALERLRRCGPWGPHPPDLAPGGVYRAIPVTRDAGGLLHHRFTLTTARAVAVCSLWHFPAGRPGLPLTTTLPCGARTFLGSTRVLTRPPGRLVHRDQRSYGLGSAPGVRHATP